MSADAQWTAFPLDEHIENLWLRYKDVDGDVSVLIPVDEYDDSYYINNLLKTSTNYVFDLFAFTGDFGISQGYSSQNVTVATLEGGAFYEANIILFFFMQQSLWFTCFYLFLTGRILLALTWANNQFAPFLALRPN